MRNEEDDHARVRVWRDPEGGERAGREGRDADGNDSLRRNGANRFTSFVPSFFPFLRVREAMPTQA